MKREIGTISTVIEYDRIHTSHKTEPWTNMKMKRETGTTSKLTKNDRIHTSQKKKKKVTLTHSCCVGALCESG